MEQCTCMSVIVHWILQARALSEGFHVFETLRLYILGEIKQIDMISNTGQGRSGKILSGVLFKLLTAYLQDVDWLAVILSD